MWDYHLRPKKLAKLGGKALDKLMDLPLANQELPEAIESLAALKSRMSIVLGLSSVQSNPNHRASYGALGCYNARSQGANGSFTDQRYQTFDHALAASLPCIIPVVGLGVHANSEMVFTNSVSVVSPKRPLPIVYQPDIASRSLFGSVAQWNAGKAFRARNKLLHWARDDIRRVRNELTEMDRDKLDLYLDTFEQMRNRQEKVNDI